MQVRWMAHWCYDVFKPVSLFLNIRKRELGETTRTTENPSHTEECVLHYLSISKINSKNSQINCYLINTTLRLHPMSKLRALQMSGMQYSMMDNTNCFPMKMIANSTLNSTKQPPGAHSSCLKFRNLSKKVCK